MLIVFVKCMFCCISCLNNNVYAYTLYVTCSTLASGDTLLELEPTSASVLKQNYYFKKLVVATVLTVAAAEV